MLNRFKLHTKIGASFGLGLAIFTTIGLIIYRGATQTIETTRWETHTYQVLSELDSLLSTIKDAENGQRGFVITGSPEYLQPYESASQVVDQKISQLRRLIADNPTQQQRFDNVESLIQQRINILQKVIDTRRT